MANIDITADHLVTVGLLGAPTTVKVLSGQTVNWSTTASRTVSGTITVGATASFASPAWLWVSSGVSAVDVESAFPASPPRAATVVAPSVSALDGSGINAAISALGSAGGTVQLVSGQAYVLDTPVVLRSNVTFDISGATLSAAGGTINGSIIQNAACSPQRTVADAYAVATTLTGTLGTGSPTTSLPVAAIPKPLPTGTTVSTYDQSSGNTQNWTLSAPAAQSATSLSVTSQTANFAYPSSGPVSSNAVVSASANFTSADVGQAVQIIGAGVVTTDSNHFRLPMYAYVASVPSATTALLQAGPWNTTPATVGNNVSNATLNVFYRDSNITILGNAATFIHCGSNSVLWSNSPPTNPNGQFAAGVLFRRITGFKMDFGGGQIDFAQGNSLINIGDIDGFNVSGVRPNCMVVGADVLHCLGPMRDGTIEKCGYVSFDNVVYLGTTDWPPSADVSGDVTNIQIRDIDSAACGADCAFLAGSFYSWGPQPVSCVYSGVTCEQFKGNIGQQSYNGQALAGRIGYAVETGNVSGGPSIGVWPGYSNMRGLVFRNVDVVIGVGAAFNLGGAGQNEVDVDGWRWSSANPVGSADSKLGRQVGVILNTAGGVLRLKNVTVEYTNLFDMVQGATGALNWLTIQDLTVGANNENPTNVNLFAAWDANWRGPDNMIFRNTLLAETGNGSRFYYSGSANQLELVTLTVDGFALVGGRAILEMACSAFRGGYGAPQINVTNGTTAGTTFGVYATLPANVSVRGVQWNGNGNQFIANHLASGATRLVASDDCTFTSVNYVTFSYGGAAFSQTGRAISMDVSQTSLTPVAGDVVTNSNAAVAPGVGLAQYDGTHWRPPVPKLSGTATLAAGTSGSIANASITASSQVRVTNIKAGGTVGALSVTLAAGTGFTINSTSGADTSTVLWEVIQY